MAALIYSRAYPRRQNHHDEAGATGYHPFDRRDFLCASGWRRVFGVRHSLRGELRGPGKTAPLPSRLFFFLEQGPENRVDVLPCAEAVRRLMRNMLFFAADPAWWNGFSPLHAIFVDTVPIRLLTFYPDASVWDVVRNFAPDFNRNIQGVPEHA